MREGEGVKRRKREDGRKVDGVDGWGMKAVAKGCPLGSKRTKGAEYSGNS